MKKILFAFGILAFALVLSGCTRDQANTDTADSAVIESNGSSGIMSPPVPPDPVR